MIKSVFKVCAIATFCLSLAQSASALKGPTQDESLKGTWQALEFNGHPYRLLLPANYDPAHTRYPLVIFLHGQGDDVVDVATPPPVADAHFNSSYFRAHHPAIVIAPQCVGSIDPTVCSWGGAQAAERIGERAAIEITRNALSQLAIDSDRVYVTGISLGGNGAWDMIWRYNDVFAAALPISGATWFWKTEHAKDLLTTPIWAAHGELDPEVPVTYDREFFRAVHDLGGQRMKYTEYVGKFHEIWDEVYADPTYFDWLFSQRRSQRPIQHLSATLSDLDNTCGHVAASLPWEYCISKTRGSTNRDVVYVLHGAGENERSWIEGQQGIDMRSYWAKHQQDAPTVVTVSFGSFWVLVSKNSAPESGLADVFVRDVIPYVESRLLSEPIHRRKLIGISIGGFNGATLMLSHPELFSAVALSCPALLRLSPYADDKSIDDYIARSPGGNPDWIREMIRQSAPYFSTAESWNQESPLPYAKKRMNSKFPPLYVSVGDRDEFGLIEGAADLVQTARSAGVRTQFVPLSGGHCVMDPSSMAQFIFEN